MKYTKKIKWLLYSVLIGLLILVVIFWIIGKPIKSISIITTITILFSSIIALTLPYIILNEELERKRMKIAKKQEKIYNGLIELTNFYFDNLKNNSNIPVPNRLNCITGLSDIRSYQNLSSSMGVFISGNLGKTEGNNRIFIITREKIKITLKFHDFMHIKYINIKIIGNNMPIKKTNIQKLLDLIKDRIESLNNVKLENLK